METLGSRVREEREARGWTQSELARRVTRAGYKIGQAGIAQIERRGATEPKSIVQLAIALGVRADYLQTGKSPKALKQVATSHSSSKDKAVLLPASPIDGAFREKAADYQSESKWLFELVACASSLLAQTEGQAEPLTAEEQRAVTTVLRYLKRPRQ